MRPSLLALAGLALALLLLGTLSSCKPLEPCPSACRCFLSEGLKRADCKHVPEWADQQSDAQDVRIVPPRPSAAGHPFALHLTHFEVFPKVVQLFVTNRSVVEIIPSGFHGLHSLQGLDLSHNLLSRFNYKVFLRMPALRRLVLQDNPIVLEPNNRLLSSRSLLSLDLSYCNIASIPPGSLDGMPKLTSLSLRGNPIQITSGQSLLHTSTIQELDLSACSLQSLPDRALENLQNLRKLYLDANKLISIEKGVLPRGLHLLDLSSNQIRDVPTAVIYSLKNLTRLEMNENPIKCTCSLLGMQGWMSRQLVVSEKPVVCAEPEKFKGLPWMKVNELELCQDEESSSSSYSQSESSDESSASETEESDDSSQPLSIEIPPASYEVFTHENVIQHPQPALALDHVLELKTLGFRTNNEINSIQGDQPYTLDVVGQDEEPLHGDESTDASTSKESLEDKERPEKRSDEQSQISEEEEDLDQDDDQEVVSDDEEATEKDAEVFMKNADTIAMGKSMPGEMDSEENNNKNDHFESNTQTPHTSDQEAEATQQPSVVGTTSETLLDETTDAIFVTSNLNAMDTTSNEESSTELAKHFNPEDGISSGSNTEDDSHVSTTIAPEETSKHDSEGKLSSDEVTVVPVQEDLFDETKSHETLTTESIAPTSEEQDNSKTEVEVSSTTPETEYYEIPIESSHSFTKQPDEQEVDATTRLDTPIDDNTSVNKQLEESSVITLLDNVTEINHPTEEPKSENESIEEQTSTNYASSSVVVEPILPTTAAPDEGIVVGIPIDIPTYVDSDRSEHARKINEFDNANPDEVNHINPSITEAPHTDIAKPIVDVPSVEEELKPDINKHVVETINSDSGDKSAVVPGENENSLGTEVPTIIVSEHDEVLEPNATEKPREYSVPYEKGHSGEQIEQDQETHKTPLTGVKRMEDIAVDNSSKPEEAEEKKSTVTYIVLGCIVVAMLVLVVFALMRGKSEKKESKMPVREGVGTEMKDMMNPLLEPSSDQPEPRRGILGSLELITEVEEGKSTSGEVDSQEAVSLLKPTFDENAEDALPGSLKKATSAKGAVTNGIGEIVVEPSTIGVNKESNGGPVLNGHSAGKHNGIPTVPSKVKVKAGVINTPLPRTPILVNRTGNGTRDQV